MQISRLDSRPPTLMPHRARAEAARGPEDSFTPSEATPTPWKDRVGKALLAAAVPTGAGVTWSLFGLAGVGAAAIGGVTAAALMGIVGLAFYEDARGRDTGGGGEILDPANPASPLSPLNPASPLFPH